MTLRTFSRSPPNVSVRRPTHCPTSASCERGPRNDADARRRRAWESAPRLVKDRRPLLRHHRRTDAHRRRAPAAARIAPNHGALFTPAAHGTGRRRTTAGAGKRRPRPGKADAVTPHGGRIRTSAPGQCRVDSEALRYVPGSPPTHPGSHSLVTFSLVS